MDLLAHVHVGACRRYAFTRPVGNRAGWRLCCPACIPIWLLLAVATTGNVLGSCVELGDGPFSDLRFADHFPRFPFKPSQIHRAQKLVCPLWLVELVFCRWGSHHWRSR